MSESTEHLTEPTGERFVPEAMAGDLIDAEHQLRYRFALEHVRGKRVLDAGCGVGWGSKLLIEAGAAKVVGVDISEEAIEDCRRRVPDVEFRLGDLMELPVDDDAFDVVVCFEALEHTSDTSRTLDELARVLAPGGLLFVSSPNPRVYPAGNPFHLHEMPPEELQAAVAQRFRNTSMFLQHQYISSLMYPDAEHRSAKDGASDFRTRVHPVVPVEPGHDPYSVAVASDETIPEMTLWQTLAPSTQLDNLGALATSLTEERELLHADHQRIVAERGVLSAELERAHQQLRDADASLRELMGQRDDALQTVADLASRVEGLDAQLEYQRSVADNAARERDEYGMRLIDAEQRSAGQPRVGPGDERESLRQRVSQLEGELQQVHRTVSWQVTRPLRSLRTAVSSRGGR
jgi:2-polyprenyl-3-methyl-5-hydroxy-6-metoxy-1,4-benzoquinol methylase